MREPIRSFLLLTAVLPPLLSGCAGLPVPADELRSPIYAKIGELSRGSAPVSLAVLCEARTSLSFENIVVLGYDRRTWPKSLCVTTQGKVEQRLLQAFGRRKGFRLVDRTLIPGVLAEQTLSLSGLVAEGSQVRSGRMTGASHLLIVEEDVHGRPGLFDDDDAFFQRKRAFPKVTRTQRLIEAESGTVLATELKEL